MSGRSSPKVSRMPWRISGSARRPARSSAGSALGRTLKRMNVIPLTTHSSRRVHKSLRMMYVPMRFKR